MDNDVGPHAGDESQDAGAITHIHLMMMEVLKARFKPPLIPTCIAGRTEKHRALIIIDAMDFKATAIEINANFRSNQTGRACN